MPKSIYLGLHQCKISEEQVEMEINAIDSFYSKGNRPASYDDARRCMAASVIAGFSIEASAIAFWINPENGRGMLTERRIGKNG